MSGIVDSLKDDEPLLDAILLHMGSMYSTLENHEKSMLVYQRVINVLESRYGKCDLETSMSLHSFKFTLLELHKSFNVSWVTDF